MSVPHALGSEDSASRLDAPPSARPSFYYGWVMVVLAAVAMTATLPGRTHGLGLITKKLTEDNSLGISTNAFSKLNFWAIILGSALCLPTGRLIDRFGVRRVLAGVAILLGACVIWMSQAYGIIALFVSLTLVRGLGQGALSVVSMAMVGKWFTGRLPIAMALFTVLLSIGFIASFQVFGAQVEKNGWRDSWSNLGVMLLAGLTPLALFLVRNTPESIGVAPDRGEEAHERMAARDSTLIEALCSRSFWAFSLAAGLFNLIWSAITLWSQILLESHSLDDKTYRDMMSMMVALGLPANFISGWLMRRWGMGRVLAVGMTMLAASLLAFPHVRTHSHALLYGALLGVAGGIVTVVFFAYYGHAFGRLHLGSIQAAAQVLTVFASALGPVLLTEWHAQTGSFDGFFYWAAPIALVLGLSVLLVRNIPSPKRESELR